MRCPNCGCASLVSSGEWNICTRTECGYQGFRAKFDPLGKVDVFKLAKLLKEKKEAQEGNGSNVK